MSRHLFLFTIGPVQSFIAQARKTHDLYAGSRLLSTLIKVAIDEVGRENVIFPHAPISEKEWMEVESLPNRFIAWVDKPESELEELAARVENKVRDEWKSIAQQTRNNLKLPEKKGFCEQIEQHLEIFWLLEPLHTEGYAKTFESIEKKLGAIKNVRNFEQYAYDNVHLEIGERGRKCSLDGQRNIKYYRMTKSQFDKGWNDREAKERFLFTHNGNACVLGYNDFGALSVRYLQPGEGLSAVSMVKRGYLFDKKEFNSTANIALANVLNFWGNQQDNYRKDFEGFNAQLFYEESLTPSYLDKQGIKPKKELEKLIEDRKTLENKANAAGFKLSKYYAIIAFDGDSMGKWLSGHEEFLKQGIDLEAFHKAFAKCLHEYSKQAKEYLDGENRGKTVYAGGDDFLGFININSLFDVLIELRQLFKRIVNDDTELIKYTLKEISFSAGICIAHYKEPLSIVLGKAKKMEEAAKDTFEDKDAFAIAVMKGSGQEQSMSLQFSDLQALTHLKSLTHFLRDNKLSNTFIQNFQRLFLPLVDDKGKSLLGASLLKTEFDRLILRGVKTEHKSDVETLAENIWSVYEANRLENFIAVLNTCNFIQRHLSNPNTDDSTTN